MPRKYRVEITPDAEADIRAIQANIALDKPEAARNWATKLRIHLRSLATFPERYEVIPEPFNVDPPYRHFIYGNYRLIYRVEAKRVLVVHVAYAGRRLNLSRLSEG